MARAYRGYLCIRGISRYFNTVRPSSGKWRNEVSESPSSSDGPARALWCARCRQYMSLSQEPKRVFCLFFSSLFFDARGILHFIFVFFFIVTFLLFALSANSFRDGSCARRMKGLQGGRELIAREVAFGWCAGLASTDSEIVALRGGCALWPRYR